MNTEEHAKQTTTGRVLTMVAIFVAILLLTIGDTAEFMPVLNPLIESPVFAILHETHDFWIVGLILLLAYRYRVQVAVTALIVYVAVHIPVFIIRPPDTAMELSHVLLTGFVGFFGVWLIDRLHKEEQQYHSLFTGMLEGLAYCKMIFKNGQPYDFVYLKVNEQFEKLTGLTGAVGKNVTDIIPDFRETNAAVLAAYGRVASTGKPEMLEGYVPGLKKWFSVSAYSPRKGYFVAVFDVINERKLAEEKLTESNNDLETAQRLTKIGNWKWDVATGQVLWSKGLCLINKWDPQKPPPPFAEMAVFYTTESWQRLNEAVTKAYTGGEPYDLELTQIRTDGIIIKTEVHGEVGFDSTGKVIDLHGTVQDITEKKHAEEQIGHLANMLRTIRSVDQLITREKDREKVIQKSCELLLERQNLEEVWILLFDPKGNIVAGRSKTASPQSSAFLKELKDGRYPDCLMQVLEPGKKFLAFQQPGKQHHGCLMTTIHSDKDTFRCKLEYDGRIYGMIGISGPTGTAFDIDERDLFIELCGDISFALDSIRQEIERKAAEEAHKVSEENFRHSVDKSPMGVRILDTEGKTVYANRALLEMFGLTTFDDLNTTPNATLYTPEAYLEHRKRVEKRSRGEFVPPRYEVSIVRPDGKIRHFEVFRSDIVWNGGLQFQQLYRDITEVKNLQEQLILQDRLVSIGQLVSGVAHELNNPLTSVIGFSDLLLEKQLPDDVRADLKIVNEEAKRTSSIVKNLLTFARQQPQEKHPLKITDPIQTVLRVRSHEQSVNSITVNTSFAPNIPLVMANGSQLQQVFFNLITNAEFAMTEAHNKGTMSIVVEKVGEYVRVSITDDGPGIPPGNMTRLFSPFFTTKDLGKGTGLGLSICQGIISEHGGRIWAESQPGKGATFVVELPVGLTNKPETKTV